MSTRFANVVMIMIRLNNGGILRIYLKLGKEKRKDVNN